MTVCVHPHKPRTTGLRDIPMDPLSEVSQLILHGTEIGPIPYCGIDNLRGNAAAHNLVERLTAARLISGGTFAAWPHAEYGRYDDERWTIPQLIISGALAAFEERFCVAEWCRQQVRQHMGEHG